MRLHQLIATKIEKNPSIIRTALATLKKWETLGGVPESRLKEWQNILDNAISGKHGREALSAILRSRTERNRRLQDFSPFAGVLTREERRKVFLKCRYDH